MARKTALESKELLDDIVALLLTAIAYRLDAPARASGVLISTLIAIQKNPELLWSEAVSIDPEALGVLGKSYRRGDEDSGTYWFDITEIGSRMIGGRQEPTNVQIVRAAEKAIQELGVEKKRGRPLDKSTVVLAKGLTELFRRYGRQPTRIVSGELEYGDIILCILWWGSPTKRSGFIAVKILSRFQPRGFCGWERATSQGNGQHLSPGWNAHFRPYAFLANQPNHV